MARFGWVVAGVSVGTVTPVSSGSPFPPEASFDELVEWSLAQYRAECVSAGVDAEVELIEGRLEGRSVSQVAVRRLWVDGVTDPLALARVWPLVAVDGGATMLTQVVRHPLCPPAILEHLAGRPLWRADAVGHPQVPVRVLVECGADPDRRVRIAVASNARTPVDVLERLAVDPEWDVREAVARNRVTPPELLHELAADEDVDVRRAVASNLSRSRETLELLAGDVSVDVVRQAQLHLRLLGGS